MKIFKVIGRTNKNGQNQRWIILAALLLVCIAGPGTAAEFNQKELAYMPATLQIELFKRGDLSPVDVLMAQKALYDKTEGQVNAVTTAYWDRALEMAQESAARYANGTQRELEGITVGIKDEHFDAGWVMTQGSLIHKNDPPQKTADPIVSKLKEAGAVPVFHTTTPEFYLNFVTSTKAWGTSRNPWNLKYAVGGSSGGSGAVLAAGYCTLATGSDMGGSIRIPASFNGIYSIKPAFNTFHADGPLTHIAGTGPMARNFTDTVILYNVINGPGTYSPNVLPQTKYPLGYKSLNGLKIAYLGGMGIVEPAKHVEKAMKDAIKVLEAQGATVDVLKFDFKITRPLTETLSDMTFAGAMGGGMIEAYADKTDQMTHYGKHFIDKAASGKYGPIQMLHAEREVKHFYKRLQDVVVAKGYDVFLCPTMPTAHVPADYDFTQDEALTEDGITFPKAAGMQYTLPWNFLNWCPVLNVPAGLSDQHMPIGMQIIGKPYDLETVLRVGKAFSKGGPKLYTADLFPKVK